MGGGIVQADNAWFVNNQQAVYFAPFNNYDNGILKNNASSFENSKFLIDEGVPATSLVELQGVRGILFENCEFTNKIVGQDITGIYANESSVRVGSLSSSSPLVKADNGCTFSGFQKGIYLRSSGINSSTIYGSEFQSNKIGMALEDVQNTTVKSCDFYKNVENLYIKGSSLYSIENNVFDGGSTMGKGIVIENTGKTNHFIKNNSFKNLCVSCLAIGFNCNVVPAGVQPEGLVFMCNEYANSQAIVVAQNSSIRQIQSGKSITSATGNLFTNQSAPSMLNANWTYFNYQWLASNPDFHLPNLYWCSNNPNPYIYTVPKEQDDCQKMYGYVGNSYYLLTAKPDMPILEDDYKSHKSVYNSKLDVYVNSSINWSDPAVTAIVEQLTALPDGVTITINGNSPTTDLEKQIVLYYELTNLKQQMDAICYAALNILNADTVGLDIEQYRKWIERFNTVESDYLLAESYMAVGDFEQARTILTAMPSKFSELDIETHINFIDYLSLAEEYYALPDSINVSANWITNAVRLSSNQDFVAVSAYSLAEIAVCGWTEMYPRNFTIHPACVCNPDEDGGRGGSKGKGKGKKSLEDSNNFDENITNKIQIYPNPTTGQLTIKNEKITIKNVEIYDVVGQVVGTWRAASTEMTIDISHLAAGLYFLKVTDENQFKITKKVVKK